MRPEISALVRHLTYPELRDAPLTQDRANIRGLRNNVVFIHHEHPEDEAQGEEHRDMSVKSSSKQNMYIPLGAPRAHRYL